MLWIVVGFKALCDAVSDLQQAGARVLELVLVREALVWFVELFQGLLHWTHALLALNIHCHYYIMSPYKREDTEM